MPRESINRCAVFEIDLLPNADITQSSAEAHGNSSSYFDGLHFSDFFVNLRNGYRAANVLCSLHVASCDVKGDREFPLPGNLPGIAT